MKRIGKEKKVLSEDDGTVVAPEETGGEEVNAIDRIANDMEGDVGGEEVVITITVEALRRLIDHVNMECEEGETEDIINGVIDFLGANDMEPLTLEDAENIIGEEEAAEGEDFDVGGEDSDIEGEDSDIEGEDSDIEGEGEDLE